MDRREFLVGAAATAVAGPVVAKDGVALTSMAHPGSLAYNFGWTETVAANVAENLTEEALERYWLVEGHNLKWWELIDETAWPCEDQPG